jgi:class 3 adenylate cyclase
VSAPATCYARTGEVHVAYQLTGDGPPLALVADWFGHLDTRWEWPAYAYSLERMGTFSQVIAFDKRGTGLSDPVPARRLPDLEVWMDDVRAVLDAVDVERADVMGVGAGAAMVLLFAAAHPHRVGRLVLVNAYARLRRDDDYPTGFPPHVVERILARSYIESGDAAVISGASGQPAFHAWWQRYQRHAVSPGVAAAMRAMMFEVDVRAVLPSIQAPTLVVHRRDDGWIRVEHGRYLAEHIPHAELVELEGDEDLFFQGDVEELVGRIELFLRGVRRPAEVDRVLATVLFTDLVDSTILATRLGDHRMRHVLDDHDTIIDRLVHVHGGHRVKRMGDGVLATFDGAARAIRCAAAIRDDLRDIGLRVRAGIHAGEIERRGDDVGGIAVNVAARIMSGADAGEIRVSRIVRELVAGSGLEFVELGSSQLRGLAGEWELYKVLV